MSAMKMKLNVFLVAFFAVVLIGEAANFQLPQPGPGGDMTLTQALKNRRTVREYELRELNQSELASLLWAACGVNRADGRRAGGWCVRDDLSRGCAAPRVSGGGTPAGFRNHPEVQAGL